MRSTKRRIAAVIAAAATVLPLVVAAPASADAMECHVVLYGPTPSAEIDTNYDGNPEVRVPSFRDVTLCVGADVELTDQPDFWSEACSEWGRCTRFFVHYGLSGYAETQVQFCYTVDGRQICGKGEPIKVPVDAIGGGTMCFGYDLDGGRPCPGDQLISFE